VDQDAVHVHEIGLDVALIGHTFIRPITRFPNRRDSFVNTFTE
jgi:hypothetical protein